MMDLMEEEDDCKNGSPQPKSSTKSTRRKVRSTNGTSEAYTNLQSSDTTTNSASTINDDPSTFGQLVTHKLRCLSARNAIMAQADIMAILQKYILDELEMDNS